MTARVSPRRRYFATILTAFALLVVSGGVSHYLATRSQRLALSRRLAALESDLASMQKSRAVNVPVAVSSERSEPVAGSSTTSVCRPRILGSGRTGRWLYSDVRYPDGYTARYYVPTNAPRLMVRQFVERLAADARDHAISEE